MSKPTTCPLCCGMELGLSNAINVTCLDSMPWQDATGRRHHHDPNWTTRGFYCEKCNHSFSTRRREGTCWCGWKAEDESLAPYKPTVSPPPPQPPPASPL